MVPCRALPLVPSVPQHLINCIALGHCHPADVLAAAHACCVLRTGQIYLPEVNFVMMILTVIVVAIFRTTTVLGNAYGEMSFHRVCTS